MSEYADGFIDSLGTNIELIDSQARASITQINNSLTQLLFVEMHGAQGASIAGNDVKDFTIDCTKQGYTLLGQVGFTINSGGGCVMVSCRKTATNTITARVRNTTSSAITPGTIEAYALYTKDLS